MLIDNNEAEAQDINNVEETATEANEASQSDTQEKVISDDEPNQETPKDVKDADDDDYVVTIGAEDSPPQDDNDNNEGTKAPEWVKELRRENRKKDRLIKELQSKMNSGQAASIKLRPKPKISDDKYDYDDEAYEADLDKWYQEKQAHDAVQNKAREAQESEFKAFKAKQDAYREQKSSVAYKDYDEIEQDVAMTLNEVQQSVIVKLSEKPTDVVYALGKRPDLLKELSSIQDPAEFIFKLGKLETQLKVTKRKPKTAPEKQVTASGGSTLSNDKMLDKLRAEAMKTGDFTKVIKYKKQLKG